MDNLDIINYTTDIGSYIWVSRFVDLLSGCGEEYKVFTRERAH